MDAAAMVQPYVEAARLRYVEMVALLEPYFTPDAWAPVWDVVPPQVAPFTIIVTIAVVTMMAALRQAVATPAHRQETLSHADAVSLPIVGSSALLSLYVILALIPKSVCMELFGAYLTLVSIIACRDLMCGQHPRFWKALVGIIIGACYWLTHNAVFNDALALALAVTAIRSIRMSFVSAAVMFVGLFFYDVFWVYGTDVMTTVALSIDGPVKIVVDLTRVGGKRSILGLGDIIVPGLFGAVVSRFAQKRSSSLYAMGLYISYAVSLVHTVYVALTQQHAQPALLFIVPWMMGTTLAIAVLRGDLAAILAFEDGGDQKPAPPRPNVRLADANIAEVQQRLAELEKAEEVSWCSQVIQFLALDGSSDSHNVASRSKVRGAQVASAPKPNPPQSPTHVAPTKAPASAGPKGRSSKPKP